jgi:replicative DNA helicase
MDMATVLRTDAGRPVAKLSSEILDRLPPQSLEAEQGVLGSLLIDPRLCDDVALVVRPDDFYADANRKLYTHMLAMHDEGKRIDTTLLVERLKQAGDFEVIGGAAYLAEVAQSVPVAAHAIYYAEIVRNKSTQRELIHASTEILRDAWDPTIETREVLNHAEEKIFAIHDRRSSDQVSSIHDVLMEAFTHIDARMEHGAGLGLPTGFTDLDNLTGGLHGSELVILAARPSMGKTALATNIAEHVAIESRATTLFVSLEMSRLELAQRMLCSQGRIDAGRFRKGMINADDRKKLVEASAKLGQAPLFVDDTASRTITEIAACARRLRRKEKLGLIVIDYLQLIEPDNARDPRQEQVAKIARRLKGLARELEIPVICLAQLNRQAEAGKENNRPKLSHLRESGAIEQDADVVMFIHREEYYLAPDDPKKKEVQSQADLIVAKQRNGPTGDLKLAFFNKYTRFEDLAQKPYEEFDNYDQQF